MISTISLMALFILSCFASTVAGIAGMGGGVIMLAGLQFILPIHFIVPLHAINQFFSNFSRIVLFFRFIEWKVFKFYFFLVPLGVYFGILLIDRLDANHLLWMLGATILISLYMPRNFFRADKNKTFKMNVRYFILIGFISGFVGVMVGVVSPAMAPFFLRYGLIKERLVATKALCQAYTHLIKLIGFSTLMTKSYFEDHLLIALLATSAILGTLLGKKIIKYIRDEHFKKGLTFLLTLVAIKLMIQGLWFKL